MHAGSRVVRLTRQDDGRRQRSGLPDSSEGDGDGEAEWRFEVLAKFEEHKSMNYGSDIRPDGVADGHMTVVSTSFYDRLLCVWRVDLDAVLSGRR